MSPNGRFIVNLEGDTKVGSLIDAINNYIKEHVKTMQCIKTRKEGSKLIRPLTFIYMDHDNLYLRALADLSGMQDTSSDTPTMKS